MKKSFLVALLGLIFTEVRCLQCMDEENNPVDWVIAYKLPKFHHDNKLINNGLLYMYMTSNNFSDWTMSVIPINASNSLIANTISKIYQKNNLASYILYNDESPSREKSEKGHTKGVVLVDNEAGLWLIHSVPKFPSIDKYDYPETGMKYGQSFLCISMNLTNIDKVGLQLQYNEPNIFAKNIQTNLQKKLPNLTAAADNKTIKSFPWYNQLELDSLGGTKFVSFAKSKFFGKDLYEDLVAPVLQSNLLVETWVNEPGRLSSNCSKKFVVKNVESIFVSMSGLTFNSTHDHSKWAVSPPNEINSWLCMGDINRAIPQEYRGGGTVCFTNEKLSVDYQELVKNIEECE